MQYVLCPRCRFRVPMNKHICTTCGFEVPSSRGPQNQEKAPEKKEARTGSFWQQFFGLPSPVEEHQNDQGQEEPALS
jgi:hypothetical protein